MKYTGQEVSSLHEEDFTGYFMGAIGSKEDKMDVITIVHKHLSFDKADKNKSVFEIEPDVFINVVPYKFLNDMKLRSRREKDIWDIARLE